MSQVVCVNTVHGAIAALSFTTRSFTQLNHMAAIRSKDGENIMYAV